MAFFSQRFGYATHALAYMAKKPYGELTTLPEMAEWMRAAWAGTSETYLSNVIQRLARGGVLHSHRGIAGGYSLAKPADEISLRQVAEVLEGVSVQRCALSMGPECPGKGRCTIETTLQEIEVKYLASLEKISIGWIAGQMNIKMPKKIPV